MHHAKKKKTAQNLNVFTTVLSEQQNVNESNHITDIYRKSCTDYYQVINCIVSNTKKRFSPESLEVESPIDNFH